MGQNVQVTKMSIADMRMLRWMCGKTRNDRIKNANIHNRLGVTQIEDKLRDNRLWWFGHICHMSTDAVVRRNDMIIGSNNTK